MIKLLPLACYRHDTGEHSAKVIYDRLRDKGYNVFLDVETLRSGAFNTKLYSVIEECRDVLVILSPNALDRCVNDIIVAINKRYTINLPTMIRFPNRFRLI
jgi:hypothetical protein